jgi:hypothetical protein
VLKKEDQATVNHRMNACLAVVALKLFCPTISSSFLSLSLSLSLLTILKFILRPFKKVNGDGNGEKTAAILL